MTWALLQVHVFQFVGHNFKVDPIFILKAYIRR